MQALTSNANKLSKPNNCQQTEIRISVRHNTQLKMTNTAYINFNLNEYKISNFDIITQKYFYVIQHKTQLSHSKLFMRENYLQKQINYLKHNKKGASVRRTFY